MHECLLTKNNNLYRVHHEQTRYYRNFFPKIVYLYEWTKKRNVLNMKTERRYQGPGCIATTTAGALPANTRHSPNVGSMAGHRLRRWPNMEPTVDERLVFAGLPAT